MARNALCTSHTCSVTAGHPGRQPLSLFPYRQMKLRLAKEAVQGHRAGVFEPKESNPGKRALKLLAILAS